MIPKRFKYLVSSVICGLCFYLFIWLPFESRWYGLITGVVLIIFCFWFGLGIIFDKSIYTRLMAILLPVAIFIGFGLFAVLLPLNLLGSVVISLAFGSVMYILFLVENVFMVAIGYKTVPLYRAAYTVSLILVLLASFFLFDTIYSFKFDLWINCLLFFVISGLIFMYQFWVITIELADDGKTKSRLAYVLIPAWLMTQIALVFSFWPNKIFNGSVYLVSVVYLLSSLIQADIRDRLFKRTWLAFTWIGGAIILAIILSTKWR